MLCFKTDSQRGSVCRNPRPKIPRVLVVDDDPILTRILALWLEHEGYAPCVCGDGGKGPRTPGAGGFRDRHPRLAHGGHERTRRREVHPCAQGTGPAVRDPRHGRRVEGRRPGRLPGGDRRFRPQAPGPDRDPRETARGTKGDFPGGQVARESRQGGDHGLAPGRHPGTFRDRGHVGPRPAHAVGDLAHVRIHLAQPVGKPGPGTAPDGGADRQGLREDGRNLGRCRVRFPGRRRQERDLDGIRPRPRRR